MYRGISLKLAFDRSDYLFLGGYTVLILKTWWVANYEIGASPG
jgi:hypothetical protein